MGNKTALNRACELGVANLLTQLRRLFYFHYQLFTLQQWEKERMGLKSVINNALQAPFLLLALWPILYIRKNGKRDK